MTTKTTEAPTVNERLITALDTLEAGIKKLTSSDEWTRFLRAQALFHDYSFSNTLLIVNQRPDATRVAGFKTWEKLGRFVRKGEKALWILAPRFYTKAERQQDEDQGDDEQSDERKVAYFRPVPVFDISQTDGEPLPAVVTKLDGDDDDGFFDRLRTYSESRGCPVTVDAIASRVNGYFSPADNRIVIAEGLSPVQACKTLAHEIAHSLLHNEIEVYRAHRADCELEAESVAFIVLNHAGIDSGAYSFGYVTTWQGGHKDALKALRACAGRIQWAAKTIIEGVEAGTCRAEKLDA